MSNLDFPTFQIFVLYPKALDLLRRLRKRVCPTAYYELVYLRDGMFFGFPNPLEGDTERIKIFLEANSVPFRVLAER